MVPILNSWKEIAAYLGRGVRTAQRWERDLALPVRRPRGKDRSAVIAVPGEIDAWLKRCPVRGAPEKKQPMSEKLVPQRWEAMHQNAGRLTWGTKVLHGRTLELRKQVERAVGLGEKLTRTQISGKSACPMRTAS